MHGSSRRLQQVLTNLLSNAINYTEEGSVSLRVADAEDELCVEVWDSGVGIPLEELPKVFQDFFRAAMPSRTGLVWAYPFPEDCRGPRWQDVG